MPWYQRIELCHVVSWMNITQARRIVALAGAANKIGNLDLLYKSRLIYGKLLASFRNTFSNPSRRNTMETLMTITLLGIYEVCLYSYDTRLH
jgi:hypothetical protein